MITYLIIFLSLTGLVVVFVHRAVKALNRKPLTVNEVEEKKEKEAEKEAAAIEDAAPEKKRVSKDEKSEIEKLYDRALVLIKKRDPKEAVKLLVQALAIRPDDKKVLTELGMLYIDQKMWGKAAAIYKHLTELKIDAKDPVDYSHLGLASYNASEFEEAAAAYQTAISLDPKRHQRYISLGHVYRDSGKPALAVIAFNHAIELDPENVDYMLLAADTQMALNDFGQARILLNKASLLNPKSQMARKMLKDLDEKEKQFSMNQPGASA